MMNEQIKKLLEQSEWQSDDIEIHLARLQNFVDEVVKVCADIADNRPSVLIDKTTGDLIKEHFGVE
jgi:ribosome recycling factor